MERGDQQVTRPADAAETPNPVDEAAWWTGGAGNSTTDPGTWTGADCIAVAGPAASVTGSNKGAFTGGSAWMNGLWVNWAEN